MVAMETDNFLKMLNDASLASLGFLTGKVLGCIICKNPLWVLSCKVGPKIPVWLPDYQEMSHAQRGSSGPKTNDISAASKIKVAKNIVQ